MEIRNDSHLQSITLGYQAQADKSVASDRQIPNTSRPNDSKKPRAIRFDAESSGVKLTSTLEQKPIDVKEAVEKLSKLAKSQQKYVNFSVDEETHSTVIKVFQSETGELIKQFPAEEILAMIANIRKNVGWLIDSSA
jgi:flagellar protein FlaG